MDKVCIIVGASSGIGEATAKLLVEKGVRVYSFSRSECNVNKVISRCVDVSCGNDLVEQISEVIDSEGRVDFLVNSAGYSMSAPFELVKEEDARYLFEVDYFAVVKAIAAVLPVMRRQGFGRIVNISSIGGVLAIPFDAYYSSAKAALNMLAEELNLELSPYGIRVTSVLPGGTATPFTFKRKLYDTRKVGEYQASCDNAAKTLADTEQNGDSAEKVAKVVVSQLFMKYPATVVAVGLKNKLFHGASRIMPIRLTEFMLAKKYALKKSYEKQ